MHVLSPDQLLVVLRQRATEFPGLVQPRAAQGHKGTYGTVVVVGGSEGMTGAAVLAGRSALKSGCGKVFIGFAQNTLPLAMVGQAPELMLTTAAEALQKTSVGAWVVGCGLGLRQQAPLWLQKAMALTEDAPLLLDADALTLLALHPQPLPRGERVVLTPHPAEAGRLLQTSAADIQADREGAAKALAAQYQAWIVLKGHRTLVASPQGALWLNDSGNVGLATAGSGDVLSGLIGGLLAQGLSMSEAVRAGVWLHGAAADYLVSQGVGPIGLTASELIDAARWLRNDAVAACQSRT
ncbi:MAG: NAD(P)H-hydrate dehydratase [Neisseriaceae bacterium]|nr:NAD(P)H-hydrate dehydratase [Neisseriaceae bacterium]MBP6861804.1 NAD(P)H-hydrate dehydratase [Neisseriaceae bacterium]